jgi:uncharacterized membrane protein
VSAYLAGGRNRSTRDLSWFLFSRGLWLVILELTVIRLFWTLYDLSFQVFVGQVIWAIGISMITLSGLIFLPRWAIGLIGLVIVAGHNAFDPIKAVDLEAWGGLWRVLHERGIVPLGGAEFFVAYPVGPWFGVMALGYAAGGLFQMERVERRRWFAVIGLLLIAAFVALRATNVYGDPRPWRVQETPLWSAFSFVNCQKYPPSLSFLLMTLGPAFLLLAAADREQGPPGARWLVTFGRVPLFFYLLHLPAIHMAAAAVYLVGSKMGWYGQPVETIHTTGLQVGLIGVYLTWLGVLVVLLPACRWFAALKQRKRSVWLSYL